MRPSLHERATSSPLPPKNLTTHLKEWRLRLSYLLLETLGALRTADMFDAVVDYPDSAPAVEDLADCLKHTVGGVWGVEG